MDGRELKASIIRRGLRLWDVSAYTQMPYSKLSAICNNRQDATPTELARINAAIETLAGERER